MTEPTEHRFSVEDVLGIVIAKDGDHDDGIDGFVAAYGSGSDGVIEVMSAEEDESERVTERFRVTVERIEGGA